MKLSRLVKLFETFVPSSFAESFDNVGLICGDPGQNIRRILVAVDLTPAVLAEARKHRTQMVLTHHPPIFQKISRLINRPSQAGLIYQAIGANIALYAMHTNLDAIEGGTNNVLADILGITADLRPVRLSRTGSNYKLVVFVPVESVDPLSEALFAAGAGRIGHQHRYRECSFASGGVGTFHGDESTSPALGRPGRREYVQELRLETIVPARDLPAVLSALRTAHPYEEPAYDLIPLEPFDDRVGMGRVGKLTRAVTAATLLKRIKAGLAIKSLRLIGSDKPKVSIAAVVAGSLSDLMPDVISSGAEFLLTGEIKHHDALLAAQNNLTVAAVGHWSSERPGLVQLVRQLNAALKTTEVILSTADSDPITIR